jgi:hypothetical protein
MHLPTFKSESGLPESMWAWWVWWHLMQFNKIKWQALADKLIAGKVYT